MSINRNLPVSRKRNVTTLSLKQMLRRTNSSLKLRLSCKMDSDYGKSLEADDCDTVSNSTSSARTSRLSETESSDDQSNSVPSSHQSSTDDVPSASIHHHTHQTNGILANSHHQHPNQISNHPHQLHSCLSTKSHNSTGSGETKKKLHFAKTVRVCLIPARCEYTHIYSDLWWTVKECESFKKDAYFELKEFIEVNKCSVKDGMFAIYQPTEEEEAEFHYIVNNNNRNNHNMNINSNNNHNDYNNYHKNNHNDNYHNNNHDSNYHSNHKNSNHNNHHTNTNNSNHNHNSHNSEAMIEQQQEAVADSTLYSALDKWSSDTISPSSSPHQQEKDSLSSSHCSTTNYTMKISSTSSCALYQSPTCVFNNGCSSDNNSSNKNGDFSPCHHHQTTTPTTVEQSSHVDDMYSMILA